MTQSSDPDFDLTGVDPDLAFRLGGWVRDLQVAATAEGARRERARIVAAIHELVSTPGDADLTMIADYVRGLP